MLEKLKSTNRSTVLKIVLFVAVAIIIVRLFSIQIVQHDEWEQKAEEAHVVQNTIVARRGEIYMMDGTTPTAVVLNETVYTIIVDPMSADPEVIEPVIDKYAGDKMTAKWEDVFANRNMRYYIVARNVKRDAIQKLKEEGLPGVWYQETSARVYPEGTLAASLLGFVNNDGVGQYGVEGALNGQLAGTNGLLKTVTDVNNVALSIGDDNVKIPAVDGDNIVLTIDRNVQYAAEKALAEVTSEVGASNGAALVMDPNTGEILAMASYPSYDASNYAAVEDGNVFINQTTEVAYEPASICKTFAFSAAINEGVMSPESTYYNTDHIEVDGWPIENASKGHTGEITMQTALSWSLNTGSTQALQWLGGDPNLITQAGKDKLYDYYYNKFKLGDETGIELYESTGIIYEPDSLKGGTDARYANMTFGQGITLTMLQVGAAFSSVVNGGHYYNPTIVAGTVDANGNFNQRDIDETYSEPITNETSATMREMLVKARKLYGDVAAKDAGYYVGGKTGTAQGVDDSGAYTFDETTASYVGFGASSANDEARYVIVTKIWESGKKFDGGSHAKPVFDKISKFMVDYLKMEPKS